MARPRIKYEDRPTVDVRWLNIFEGAVKKRLLIAVREREPLEEVKDLWKIMQEVIQTKMIEAYYGEVDQHEQE
jgi:hypothetical protein